MSCPRHEHCAYTGQETDRCPFCHTTWERVRQCACHRCGQSRRHHIYWHVGEDARVARSAAKRALASDVRAQ